MRIPILLVLLLPGVVHAFVFSCQEVKSKLINSAIEFTADYLCVVPSERFEGADALKTIYIRENVYSNDISLYDILGKKCVGGLSSFSYPYRIVSDLPVTLTCDFYQQFTLIFTSNHPVIHNVPYFVGDFRSLIAGISNGAEELFVSPQTGMAMRKRQCTGEGNVTVFTGAGSGEAEFRYLLKSWSCTDLPDLLLSFESVITVSVDAGVQLYLAYDAAVFMNGFTPQHLERVAVMSSGRSDNLQDPISDNANFRQDTFKDMVVDVVCSPCLFDTRYNQYAKLTAYADNPVFNTSSQEMQASIEIMEDYIPPEHLGRSQEHFVFELSFRDEQPTTPVRVKESDPYCKCELDPKFGMPVDWDPTAIWLDIAIILDTSEAMGEVALIDASTLIESFFGTEDSDVLVTNSGARFYTRVGLIAMSDTAEVLFNLNMTKADKILDKVAIKKDVSTIDVVDSFKVAEQMLIDGQQSSTNRQVRQVIYYMTDSDPLTDTTSMNQFKTSNGIIIVNNFVEAGDTPRPGLKNLASDGYYYTDIQDNYMASIQLFCKANCYCKADKESYAGRNVDPAVKASAMAKAAPKSSYFWIGYSKSDDNVWSWEDKSTNPYTNWDKDEPSASDVAKCAYVDTTSAELYWGAGNCNVGFPSVCEIAPCAMTSVRFILLIVFIAMGVATADDVAKASVAIDASHTADLYNPSG